MTDLGSKGNASSGAAFPVAPLTRRGWWLYCICLLFAAYAVMAVVPSFQAPDEFDHVRRAYLLGHGQLMLESVDGSPSGGYIDPALEAYMVAFTTLPHHPENRFFSDARIAAERTTWTYGIAKFEPAFATAYYFPALYAPQAAGLLTGQLLHLPVGQSYRLARVLSLLTAITILIAAYRVSAPPPLAAGILALPMSLFLLSSAALDGVATSVAVLALSAFARMAPGPDSAPRWCFPLLLGSVFLVTSCRANLIPMFALPLAVAWTSSLRSRRVGATFAVAALVLLWTIFTIKTTVYPAGPRDVDRIGRLLHFAFHPGDFFQSLAVTVGDIGRSGFYVESFIGVMGWLDTYLPRPGYRALFLLLVVLAACSYVRGRNRRANTARLLLVACAVASVLLTFLALLVQWVPPGTAVITGIQGRYFTVPALMLAYALTIDGTGQLNARRRFAVPFAALLLVVSASFTIDTLVKRYQLPPEPSDLPYRVPPT